MWDVKRPTKQVKERPEINIEEAIRKMLIHPDFVSKEWAYSQFDYEVGTSTVIKPGEADASVIVLPNQKLLAVKGDANPDLCEEDAYECGKYIVAETYRNLATVGAKGIGIVDHLQFGDPRKPEVYYTFVEALRGIAEAAKFFNTPVVGGKVSFHNENKEGKPIKPTPLVVMAGLVENKFLRPSVENGLSVVMLGLTRNELRGTFLTKLYGSFGDVPKVRLNEDLLASELIIQGINEGKVKFAKDVGRGGLVTALFPILIKDFGLEIQTRQIKTDAGDDLLVKLFSESSGRFVVLTDDPEWFIRNKKGVVASIIGKVNSESHVLKIDGKSLDLSREVENYHHYLYKVIEND
jgi:phosphoribosylformylglycinamidine synthase subunit II (EC 6.3.5.3)